MQEPWQYYDIFLVDAYGVFWDGAGFIRGAKERLEWLVMQGKTVLILSNTTQLAVNAAEKYARHGLLEGIHYHAFVTSGEVTRAELAKGLRYGGREVRRYYTFATVNKALFSGLEYQSTSLEKAEFIYIGVPQLTLAQQQSQKGRSPLYLSSAEEGLFDTTDIGAFTPLLAPLIESGLPVLCANPDTIAPEKCKATGTINPVIRQGAIAEVLEQAGLEVRQIGKPYTDVYSYCRTLLCSRFGMVDGDKVAMVGDTLATDILGAHNATTQLGWKVDSILTLTGNSKKGEKGNCMPHWVVGSVGLPLHMQGADEGK